MLLGDKWVQSLIYNLITNRFLKKVFFSYLVASTHSLTAQASDVPFLNQKRGYAELCMIRITLSTACSAWQKEMVFDYSTVSKFNSCHHSTLRTRGSPYQWTKIIGGLPSFKCKYFNNQSSTEIYHRIKRWSRLEYLLEFKSKT